MHALAAGLGGVALDTLMLDANLIGDRGLRLLLGEAASLRALKHLSLSQNQVTANPDPNPNPNRILTQTQARSRSRCLTR